MNLGLVHEDGVLVGQARGDGPLLLSWPDSAQSPLLDGWNVVIHECAHKLDMQTGAANGCPALHSGMKQAAWADAFGRAYDTFCTEVERGTAGWLDPYASESPAEFFAVLSEYSLKPRTGSRTTCRQYSSSSGSFTARIRPGGCHGCR